MHPTAFLFQSAKIVLHQFHCRNVIAFLCQGDAVASGTGANVQNFYLSRFPVFSNCLKALMNVFLAGDKLHPSMAAVQTLVLIKFVIIGF